MMFFFFFFTELTSERDPLNWTHPASGLKSTTAGWSCEWNEAKDNSLLIGAWRHGFGRWDLIRDDPELGLSDSIFLEEPKRVKGEEPKTKSIPSGVHLTRRGDYLLRALREYHEQQELEQKEQGRDGFNGHHATQSTHHHSYSAADTQHRSSRPSGKTSHSSRPPKKQHTQQRPPKARHHSPAVRASSKSSSELTEEADEEDEELEEDEDSMDEGECKEAMRPVKKELKELRADESKTIGGPARGKKQFVEFPMRLFS
jgi:chromodomain-helicase-DNA-binding protein 1